MNNTALSSESRPFEHLTHLNVVFKISERCNLACDYCYFFFGGDESWKQHPATAKITTLESAARFFRQVALAYKLPRIVFVLHGGEPLLVKKPQFRKICAMLRAYETEDFQFQIVIQTNAALIDEEWVTVFSEHQVTVGVSLDGNKAINDLHRFDKQGKSSYDDTVRGIRLLQAAAEEGRVEAPGIICVIQPEADGKETYRHFVDELGIKNISFRTLDMMHGPSLDIQKVEATNRFMLAALNEWLKDNDGKIRIRQFQEPMRALLSDKYAALAADYQEDIRNIICVSSNGDIGPDDSLKVFDTRFSEMGLNIARNTGDDLFASAVWEELHVAATKKPETCQSCKWWNICKGGRLVTRFSKETGLDNPSVYCEGLKGVYQTIETALLRSGIPQDSINKRLGISQKEEKYDA